MEVGEGQVYLMASEVRQKSCRRSMEDDLSERMS